MANRFETGRFSERALLDLHKGEFLSRSHAILKEHDIDIGEKVVNLKKNNAYFHLFSLDKDSLRITMETQHPVDQEYYLYDRATVLFSKDSHNSSVDLVQGKRKIFKCGSEATLSKVSVNYNPMNEQGEAVLFDPEIEVTQPADGLHVYSSADKTVDWRKGMALLINEDEAADALIVQVDYNAESLLFPKRVDMYQKLKEVEEELRG